VWVYRNATGSTISTGAAVVFTTASAVTSKAGAAREFTVAANNTLQSAGGEQDVAYDNADVGSATISGLPSKEYLFFRAIAVEGDSSTATTVTSSYTNWTLSIGQAGTSPTSVETRGEHRILTATGDSSDPTVPVQDYVTTYVALQEVSAVTPHAAPFIFQ
jgi:type II secretory pathway pseudopilin PulG